MLTSCESSLKLLESSSLFKCNDFCCCVFGKLFHVHVAPVHIGIAYFNTADKLENDIDYRSVFITEKSCEEFGVKNCEVKNEGYKSCESVLIVILYNITVFILYHCNNSVSCFAVSGCEGHNLISMIEILKDIKHFSGTIDSLKDIHFE